MLKTCISKSWLFKRSVDPEFAEIDIPHDYAIKSERDPNSPGGPQNGYYGGGVGRYIKYMKLEGTHTILDLDGAYMCTAVEINGDRIAMHPYGYTPFLVDLTEKIHPGRTNKLELITNAVMPSTRWYSGAGVYRDVFLWQGGKVRVEPWDLFLTTESIEEDAGMKAAITVTADKAAEITLKAEYVTPCGEKKEAFTKVFKVKKGKTNTEVAFKVDNPALWSCEEPNLYRFFLTINVAGEVTDQSEVTFGIRTFTVNAEEGLKVNGKPMKLRGGCIHHDHGGLGAAAYPAAEERKIRLLKETGFNSIRTAHYPPSLALLEACDKLGVIVMDEAFDMWNKPKNVSDYSLWFADWWKRDIDAMVLRDRNHASVLSYSIGNEIIERDGSSDGAKWSKLLADEVRRLDDTRFVTSGICGMWNRHDSIDPDDYWEDHCKEYTTKGGGEPESEWDKQTYGYMKALDIIGYNYIFPRYELDHQRYPDRVIWGSETHSLRFYDSWHTILRCNHVLGDYTWTAIDNLGEAGAGKGVWARDGYLPGIVLQPYPWRTCFQGDLDLCGFRRPQSYYREAIWIGGKLPRIFTIHPEHYGEGFSGTGWHWYDVLDSWTFDEQYVGSPVECQVYTEDDEVEFILNGRSVIRVAPEKAIARADIPYEKGTLTAVAYKDGKETGRFSLFTVGEVKKIKVEVENASFNADGRDLCYFDLTLTDIEGNRVPFADNEITCRVTGGELITVFSGAPANEDNYNSGTSHAFEGHALAVVKTKNPGEVCLIATSDGLSSGNAKAFAK